MPNSTKQTILDTLIAILQTQPLDGVTVKDLTEHCGISRQAFYYHFPDIYSVVEWGAQQLLSKLGSADDWRELLDRMGKILQEERTVLLNTYHAFERSYVEHRLKNWLRPMMTREIQKTAQKYKVTQEQSTFVAELFTMGIVSVLLSWVDLGLPRRINDYLDDFYIVLDGSAEVALQRLERKNLSGRSAWTHQPV